MAIFKRTWKTTGFGRKVRRVAFGYSLMRDGKQIRRMCSTWTREDAKAAEAAAMLEREIPASTPPAPSTMTLAALTSEYLDFKRAKGKRSLEGDARAIARRLLPWFGAETPVSELTALRIAQYDRERSIVTSRLGRTVAPA